MNNIPLFQETNNTVNNYFIEVVNAKVVGHPISEENLLHSYGVESISQLPSRFEKFIKKDQPILQWYQRLITTYEKESDGNWTDIFEIVELPEDQRIDHLSRIKPPYQSWVINDEKTSWIAPKPHPTDGKYYHWEEIPQEWVENVFPSVENTAE